MRFKRGRALAAAGLGLGSMVAGFAAGLVAGRRRVIPLPTRDSEYAIGIYTGSDVFDLSEPADVRNPVLTAKDVTDLPARFVADPFLTCEDGRWQMFFEVIDARTDRGCIGLATSDNGRQWTYDRIVLSEPYHLSYPYVFKWDGAHYMLPESEKAYGVRLYRATSFPYGWSHVATLLQGRYVDASPFRHDDRWWMFAGVGWGYLHLFFADELTGPWAEHPMSPLVVGDDSMARPGGRVLVESGRIVRFAQNDFPYYGRALRAFCVERLTTTEYREREADCSPVLEAAGSGWNARGMHHIDPHCLSPDDWLACVDGFKTVLRLGITPDSGRR